MGEFVAMVAVVNIPRFVQVLFMLSILVTFSLLELLQSRSKTAHFSVCHIDTVLKGHSGAD